MDILNIGTIPKRMLFVTKGVSRGFKKITLEYQIRDTVKSGFPQ